MDPLKSTLQSFPELSFLTSSTPASLERIKAIVIDDDSSTSVFYKQEGQDWFSKGLVAGVRRRSLSVCSEDSSLSLNVEPEAAAKTSRTFFQEMSRQLKGSRLPVIDLYRSLAPKKPKYINYWLDRIPTLREVSVEALENCEAVLYSPLSGHRQISTMGWIRKENFFYKTRLKHNGRPDAAELKEGRPSFFVGEDNWHASARGTIQLVEDVEVFDHQLPGSMYPAAEFLQVLRQVGQFPPVSSASIRDASCEEAPAWEKILEAVSWRQLFRANGVRNLADLKFPRYHPSNYEFSAVVVLDDDGSCKPVDAICHFTVTSKKGKKEKAIVGKVCKERHSVAADYTLKKKNSRACLDPKDIIAVTKDQWALLRENVKTISRRNEVKYSTVQNALYQTANGIKISQRNAPRLPFSGSKRYRNLPPQPSRSFGCRSWR